MNKKLSIALIGLALISGGGILAQSIDENSSDVKTRLQERVQVLEEKKAALKLKNCERVENKLQNKIKVYEQNKKKHLESFIKSYQRIVSVSEHFEDSGYDTAVLRDHLAVMDSMIKKFDADYSLYIETTQDSQNFSCTENETTFRVKLNHSREQLGSLKRQAVAIRTYWAQTVRLDIQNLKSAADVDEEQVGGTSENNEELN